MAIFEAFYRVWKNEDTGETMSCLKLIDLERVETFENVVDDEDRTNVYMQSGEKFSLDINHNDFAEILLGAVDGYGKLFMFNKN